MHHLSILRPRSWLKNMFIVAPIFFAGDLFIADKVIHTVTAFVLFCMAASSAYILNDLMDIEQDRKHSTKKHRAIAAGHVSIHRAVLILTALVLFTVMFGLFYAKTVLLYAILYFLINVLYSKRLKHIPVIDMLCISAFFFIRIMVGGVAASVPVSYWLLLCTIFLSLFLIVGKRLAEFQQIEKREVLKSYTLESLRLFLVISATLSIISYSMYAVVVLQSMVATISIFFVLLGILRYLFLVFTSTKAEYPEKVVLDDYVVFWSVIGWVCTMFYIFYI